MHGSLKKETGGDLPEMAGLLFDLFGGEEIDKTFPANALLYL